MKHCLTLLEYKTSELQEILSLGVTIKSQLADGRRLPFFSGHVLGLLFQKPSLRTRVSFESLISQHGGSSLYLGSDVGWPDREPARDFFPILSSYLDLLVIRGKSHADVVEAASFSQCPVINGLTDVAHPCQALADILTIQEIAGGLEGVKVAYIGDANNVARSLAIACSKLGVELRVGSPKGYQFPDQFVDAMNASAGRELIIQTADPREAVRDVSFVYSDVWTSMGQESENEARLKAFVGWQVTPELMRLATPSAKFLHCLPARRGEEVAAAVIDGPDSVVKHQAENRLHAQKGLVAWLLKTPVEQVPLLKEV